MRREHHALLMKEASALASAVLEADHQLQKEAERAERSGAVKVSLVPKKKQDADQEKKAQIPLTVSAMKQLGFMTSLKRLLGAAGRQPGLAGKGRGVMRTFQELAPVFPGQTAATAAGLGAGIPIVGGALFGRRKGR